MNRQTSLPANIVQFCRFLRQRNFAAGPEEEATVLQALQYIDYTNLSVFHLALKTVICKSKIQAEEFDDLFDIYWKQIRKATDAKVKDLSSQKKQTGAQPDPLQALKTWLHGNRNNKAVETAIYSLHGNLLQKDFSAVPDEEIEELMHMIRTLARRLAARASRRYKFSSKTAIPDLRQTLRKNLRRGGELLELVFRKQKRNRTKVLLFCDVSKSMELYSVFLIQFMYAFQRVYSRMETFVFGTSLKRITPVLKEENFRSTLGLLGQGKNWSGGTRIGECLDSFVKDHSSKMLDHKTIVIIVSDGWDKGNMETLRGSMESIHDRAKKIIWLNPLAGFAGYRPDVIGMQTAMPFIDVFAPVHNAESLKQLSKWL